MHDVPAEKHAPKSASVFAGADSVPTALQTDLQNRATDLAVFGQEVESRGGSAEHAELIARAVYCLTRATALPVAPDPDDVDRALLLLARKGFFQSHEFYLGQDLRVTLALSMTRDGRRPVAVLVATLRGPDDTLRTETRTIRCHDEEPAK